MTSKVTIWRVELDFHDDEVAQVHWYVHEGGAEACAKDARSTAAFLPAEDRHDVEVSVSAHVVELSQTGLVDFLNNWCSSAEVPTW